METLTVRQVTPDQAAAAMRAAGLRVAMPWDTPEAIAARGECFEMRTAAGACAVVAHREDGVLWIDAAAAHGPASGMTAAGLALAEETARLQGCGQVSFQTVRPGLVRQAKRHGYVVAGYIMKKAMQ